MPRPVYLDAISTTPPSGAVRAAMEPYFTDRFALASGAGGDALDVRDAVNTARGQVREMVGADPTAHVVFTPSGSAANALGVLGFTRSLQRRCQRTIRILASPIEHPSIAHNLATLRTEGHQLSWLPVDAQGRVDCNAAAALLGESEIDLLIIHLGNYDIGTRQDVASLGAYCRAHNVTFMVDATHAGVWLPLDFQQAGVDCLTLSPHRFFGPAGVGVLVIRSGIHLDPLFQGGAQESGLWPGTGSSALHVGAGMACHEAKLHAIDWRRATQQRQERFLLTCRGQIDGVILNGPNPGSDRDPHHLSLSFESVDAEAILLNLDLKGVRCAALTGCLKPELRRSAVLETLGVPVSLSRGTLLFGFLPDTSEEDIDFAVAQLANAVARVRSCLPH